MSSVVRVRSRAFWAWVVLAQGLVLGFGCGGQSEGSSGGGDDDELGGSAGTITGGMSNGGSSPGTGGTPSGGSSSGTGGTPSGGASGSAGSAGLPNGAECATAADCKMVSDCCSCRAVPRSGEQDFCPLDCIRDPCGEGGIDPSEVECVMGRCVVARNCNGNVTCPALPPNCGDNVPSVHEGCWGPCLPPTECMMVPSCDVCGDAVCVQFDAWAGTHHCLEPGSGCSDGNYCECLGACTFACYSTDEGIGCSCPVC